MVRVAVVGGGLIGLATARRLLQLDGAAASAAREPPRRQPRIRAVTVYEAASCVASAQSGHNSGVIHAGIYYAPGSLKARLCVQGARALYDYCSTRPHIPLRRAGKFIVATEEWELPRLQELYERARANGVPGVKLVELRGSTGASSGGGGGGNAHALPPACVRGGLRALYSPATGIVSFRALAESFADETRADARGAVRTSHPVPADVTAPEDMGADVLVYCTGLRTTRALRDMRIVPFRGQYYELAREALRDSRRLGALRDTNVYPVPDPRFPFAGVHFTPTVDGRVIIGPTATVSGGDVFASASAAASTLLFPGFWRLVAPYAAFGAREAMKEWSGEYFVRALQRYVPALRAEDVRRSFAGVRAQAVGHDGRLVDDFVFRRGGGDGGGGDEEDKESRVLHVCNAPSPAATSCMAIAEHIVNEQLLPMMTDGAR